VREPKRHEKKVHLKLASANPEGRKTVNGRKDGAERDDEFYESVKGGR